MNISSDMFREICLDAALELAETDIKAAEASLELMPSERFNKKMQRLMPHVKKDKYHSLTTTAKVILVAAVIASLLLLSVSAKSFIEKYLLIDHGLYSEYIIGRGDGKIKDELSYGYIPERFYLTEKYISKTSNVYEFEAPDGDFMNISKDASYNHIHLDTENSIVKEFNYNGIDYLIWGADNVFGIIWHDDTYLYRVGGTLTEDEIIKIALDIH